MKKWRNDHFDAECKPKSYLITLLVIKAYERAGIFGVTSKSPKSEKIMAAHM